MGLNCMHPVAEQLLEQHILFELDALTGDALAPAIRVEVQRGFELADQLTLREFATERRCMAAFKRVVVKAKVPTTVGQLGMSLFLRGLEHLEHAGVEVRAVMGRDRFLAGAELAAGLDDTRRRLAAALFNHPLYGELISSLVYKALLKYLIEDNLISQKVPGVGSVLKLGQRMVNRTGLEETVERQLKNYIKGYLPSLISASEQYVEGLATDENLLDRIDDAWSELGAKPLAGPFEDITTENIEDFAAWSQSYWDELRRSDDFLAMGEVLIADIFEHYGDQSFSCLLHDLGITRGLVNKELLAFVPPLLKRLRQSGYLDELLRSRLTQFYDSEAVAELLAASLR